MIKRKLYIDKIRPFIDTDIVKVLSGMRRCGKSVMLELIKEELLLEGRTTDQFISINFEALSSHSYKDYMKLYEYLSSLIKKQDRKYYLFLDEIQEVEQWEKVVNSLRVEFDVDIYITGSNAKLLSGELATYLAGRYIEIVIHPLSFDEFCLINKKSNKDRFSLFMEYIKFGGMPFLANLKYDEEPSHQYLDDIYSSIVLKDILTRNSIRDVDLLQRILLYAMANIGRSFSATSLSKYFKSENRKVNTETILNYLSYCEDSFLLRKVKREDLVGKKILSVSEKYYLNDHGIREAVYGRNSEDIELILENIIYMELVRRGYEIKIGRIGDKEIDFIAERRGKRIYVQVCYLLASKETIEREFGVYYMVKDNYPKYVISMDQIDLSRDGIIHRNIIDFLLDMKEY